MNTDEIIQGLLYTLNKIKGRTYSTGELNVEDMISDILPAMYRLKEYEEKEKSAK